MSVPQIISARVTSHSAALAKSEEDPVVVEAGFDPEHVGHRWVTIACMEEEGPPTSQTFDFFVAQDETGRSALEEAGYHRIEAAQGDRLIMGYLSPEQYTAYTAFQERRMETRIREAAHRIEELTGPHRRRGFRAAEAAIKPWTLFTGDEGRAFDAQTIDPNAGGTVRRDAEAVLRERGLIPHRIEGDPTEYWMKWADWVNYERDAQRTGAPRIYHD